MRHRLSGKKLSRPSGHRSSMLRGMVTDLLRHEAIQTTEAKAFEVRRMTEKVITKGKGGTLHDRRQVLAVLTDKAIVRKLFDELATRYDDRPGGYTRITKLGGRRGDAAPMAMLELLP